MSSSLIKSSLFHVSGEFESWGQSAVHEKPPPHPGLPNDISLPRCLTSCQILFSAYSAPLWHFRVLFWSLLFVCPHEFQQVKSCFMFPYICSSVYGPLRSLGIFSFFRHPLFPYCLTKIKHSLLFNLAVFYETWRFYLV